MKPVSVRFQCFGPYMAEQCIDFTELQKNGLFLICGETGAGKTAILDAICYALYGRSSGGLRGELAVMRCKLAGREDETLVEFIFDANGRRYKFIRSLKYGRKNLNDSHNCLVLEDGEYVPIFENPKATVVNQKAQELIGLTYDQFRQVIILPQGQFERLLVSDSAEKEKILVSLFHADRWQRVAEELYRRVSEQDTGLKQEKAAMAAKLLEYRCRTLAELSEAHAHREEAVTALAQAVDAAEAVLTAARKQNEEALLEDKAFQDLAQAERTLYALETREAHFAAEAALLQNADAAEVIRPAFQALRRSEEEKCRAQGLVAQAQTTLDAAEQALTQAEAAQRCHEEARGSQNERQKLLAQLEAALPIYESLTGIEQAAKTAKADLTDAEKAQRAAQTAFAHRDQAWQEASLSQRRAMEDYLEAQAAYHRGIGSILAQKLTDGQPCPVCGSREHPAPALPTADHITDAQLEAKKAAMSEANDREAQTKDMRAQAEITLNLAREACADAARQEAAARAEYDSALARRLPDIGTLAQLKAQTAALKSAIEDFHREEELLRQRLSEAQLRHTAALSRAEAAREEWTAALTRTAAMAAAWEAALADSPLVSEAVFLAADMTPDEKQRRRKALLEFQAALAQARQTLEIHRAALKDATAPDLAAIRKALTEAEHRHRELSGSLLLAQKDRDTMAGDIRSLTERQARYDLRRAAVDADLDYANRLRGRSGVSLQRYVLGVMLTSITVEANRLLERVYGGRYRLFRTDEIAGSGRKGGLELEVCDSQTGTRRSVTTLSGGEKFLVALSLAIGLSTVVQAQGSGIRLEAMFIDEGFGSLDTEAIQDALEVLQGIQRSAGIVGIISHVDQLAEVIPTRLEITKGRSGSTCRIRG